MGRFYTEMEELSMNLINPIFEALSGVINTKWTMFIGWFQFVHKYPYI